MRSIYTHKQIKKWKAEVLHRYPSSISSPRAAPRQPAKHRRGACQSQAISFAFKTCKWWDQRGIWAEADASKVETCFPLTASLPWALLGALELLLLPRVHSLAPCKKPLTKECASISPVGLFRHFSDYHWSKSPEDVPQTWVMSWLWGMGAGCFAAIACCVPSAGHFGEDSPLLSAGHLPLL